MNRPLLDAASPGAPAPAPRAGRMLWRRGLRWLRWALLGLLLSLALTLALLHWWLLPRIDQWRPALERYASQATGLQLQLGRLQAQTAGLLPSLVAWDVQARARDGRMALHVPQARVELSWQMLWRQGVAALVLHRPALYLSATASPASAASAAAPALAPDDAAVAAQPAPASSAGAAVWRWLQRQPELRVEQGSLVWQQQPADQAGPAQVHWALHHIDWQLRHTVLGAHQLQLSLAPQPAERDAAEAAPAAAVRIEGQWRGSWGGAQPGLPDGRWQLQLQAVPVQQLQPILQTAQQWAEQWAQQTGRPWPQAWAALAQPQAASGQIDAQLQLRLRQGQLARADASVQLGQWQLRDASAQAAPPWLHWEQAQARLTLLRQEGGPGTQWHLTLEPVQLQRGRWQWRSGPMQLSLQLAPGQHWSHWRSAQGQLQWSDVELAPLAALLQPPQPMSGRAAPAWRQRWQAVQHELARWQPAGRLQALELSWHGAAAQPASQQPSQQPSSPAWLANAPQHWQLRAQWQQLRLGMQDERLPAAVAGLSGTLQADARQGQATLSMAEGAVRLPRLFEPPHIPVEQLQAQLHWQRDAQGLWQLQLQAPQLANAHARGQLRLHWRNSTAQEVARMTPRKGRQPGPWPGHLDLRASLSQADATAVWRYLPRSIAQPVRHYVRDAVRQGRSRQVQFEVRGPLHEFPFAPAATPRRAAAGARAGAGEALFRIQAELEDVSLRYLPHALLPPGTLPLAWPDLQALAGTLVFEGQQMRLQVRQGQLQAAPQVHLLEGQARIDDLTHARLHVQARAQGPLQAQLDVLATTPAARMTGHVLDTLQGDGAARLELQLDIPLEAAATRVGAQPSVQGRVHLQGNQLRWWPQVPQLQQVQGSVQFTHQGFAAQDLQAQALGGPLRLTLASQPLQPGQPFRTRIEAQGQLSADGLRQYAAQALGQGTAQAWLAPLHGQSSYQLQVQTVGERAYIDLASDLQGLGSHLPAPLDKPAASAEPLRLWHAPATQAQGEETLQLQWGQRLYARYRLAAPASAADAASAPAGSSAPQPASANAANAWRVLGGEVLIGAFSADERRLAAFIPNSFAPAPITPRVRATIAWPQWNASAWLPWLYAQPQPQPGPAAAAPSAAGTPVASSASSAPPAWQAFLPDVWYAKLARLQLGAVGFDAVQAQIYRSEGERRHWVARLKSRQAQGTLEYHPDYLDGTGLLRGKVAYLELPATLAEQQGDGKPATTQAAQAGQPSGVAPAWADVTHLPTVDLEIERLLLARRDWGRVALQAVNQVQAGAPSQWRINYLTMTTPKARLTAKGSWRDAARQGQPSALLSGRKQMDMRFTLEMFDAGGLLARLGMPGVLQGGQGQLDGRLSWSGSPLKLDLPSLGGALHLQVRRGQFLQASAGAARLLGVLSLQALPRRLSLDFRDVFSSGFAFDFIQGDVRLEGGQARTNNLQMKGVNAGVLLEGVADLVAETQDIQAVVVPELDAMTASLVATAINPAVGAGTFLAQFFLSKPLAESAARQFHIHGTWSEPQVERLARPAAAQQPQPESGDAP
ncbi:hypothetical protein EBQ34_02245 [Vandammella animalimorsus]|uniref:YhdP central domain-containing protein n=1 Tax=Vandammella animalimorsus TaxID=2029117 RepID=A0A3M6RTM9_9BURK|nr:AsmA-like C-terminal region-containing protein [Vandammella animalimorsus]RMX18562.1 hypothetical protein EBQ34_02245 [Vandammella animalimorsus]